MIRLCDEVRLDLGSGLLESARIVRDDGEHCIVQRNLIQLRREFLRGRFHQRGVERCGDRQNDSLLRPLFLQKCYRLLNALCRARNHCLSRAVEVDRLHSAHGTRLGTDRDNSLIIESNDRRHRTLAHGYSLLHISAALVHEDDRIAEGQHARRNERRVFAETVPRRNLRHDPLRAQQLCGDDRYRENRRLCMRCQLKLVGRSLKTELADGIAEGLICFRKILFRKVVGIVEIFPHPDDLRPLSGE